MFAIKRNVLAKLFTDDECLRELDEAKTWLEVERILAKYSEKYGFKVATVDTTT